MRLNKCYFSSGFLLLCAWLLYRDDSGMVWQGLLACFLHEIGHYAVLKHFHSGIQRITFTCFGAKMTPMHPLSYRQEWAAAAAGPAVNLLLARIFCDIPAGQAFAGLNLSLALFNLLPAGQLDGARMLRCTAAILSTEEHAFLVSRRLSFFITALFLFSGVYAAFVWRNLTLLLMCFWLIKNTVQKETD